MTQSLTLVLNRIASGRGVSLSVKRSLFGELRRRNVFKAGAAYLALGWVVVQITATPRRSSTATPALATS
jgi:hypothetical protein